LRVSAARFLQRATTGTLDATMPTRELCVQIQPNRAKTLSTRAVTRLMAEIAEAVVEVREFSFNRGQDRGPYINYRFKSRSPNRVWQALGRRAFRNGRLSPLIRRSSIVTCQGSRGWDNYLLLHHYDANVPLDRLRGV
jgi:hypothetical protein